MTFKDNYIKFLESLQAPTPVEKFNEIVARECIFPSN